MSGKLRHNQATHGDRALEMIMRDVLDGMREFAYMAQYSLAPGDWEILAEPCPEPPADQRSEKLAGRENPAPAESTKPDRHPRRSADIVSLHQGRSRDRDAA